MSNRFMIAGTNSGCGKTTVTCAVLAALKARVADTAAFKCGPDYIDPMFHRRALGIPAHNLDSFFCGKEILLGLLGRYSRSTTVIEGVMGFYDGAAGSAYSVSQLTETPAVLVIDCKGMSDSIGAVMSGFLNYRRPNGIAGFIFNRLPLKLKPLAERLCGELGTEYLGCLPKTDITFESRHLGLVTADEDGQIREKLAELGRLAEEHILIDRLLAINASEPKGGFGAPLVCTGRKPVIAAARDRAFCFVYPETFDMLEDMGCEVRFFSPLEDGTLPDADGLILCGGYPELYARELSENVSMRESVNAAVRSGLPTIAECGGFMYLHEELCDGENSYAMAGALGGRVYKTERLQRFGYVTMTAREDSMLCRAGEQIKAHEFHYWDSTDCGSGFTAEKTDDRKWDCCVTSETLYAGFPHIYMCAEAAAAERFVRKCEEYGNRRNGVGSLNYFSIP